ncbi:anthrone oxygenase family protein [Kitasatospora sp. NPDC058032]|uniref:anthrone oxygenase family protein n=1 Tax=Kitasatospora sp. NPDC058032 TaxID=3346307 RepID=UPI0036D76CDC
MRVFALVAATVTTGVTSGLFYTYASLTPGLRTADSLTVVQVMQRLNVAVLNGWYLLGFVGALVFTGASVLLHLPSDARQALPASVGALVCYTGSLVATRVVNLPLSQALADADRSGGAGRQEREDREDREDRAWHTESFDRCGARRMRWTAARALLSTAALGFLCWALVLHCDMRPN